MRAKNARNDEEPCARRLKPGKSVSSLKKRIRNRGADIRNLPFAEAIYLFRCGETGLYALTADPSGKILPSKLYPQIKWRLERHVTLQPAANSPDGRISRATRGAIAKHGFYLTHAAAHSARYPE